jgi:hypothetical protein
MARAVSAAETAPTTYAWAIEANPCACGPAGAWPSTAWT